MCFRVMLYSCTLRNAVRGVAYASQVFGLYHDMNNGSLLEWLASLTSFVEQVQLTDIHALLIIMNQFLLIWVYICYIYEMLYDVVVFLIYFPALGKVLKF